ncbi:RDD family protein [Actinoplanes sp. NPDC023801]|uniref:RDD family protein n=1 Tax=Actinoplanes sp. NPDC023801 TaxID=3154595 RepID=UPI0033D5AC90
MSSVPAGWYKDPADTSTQRYWDGEGWLGKAIPADAVPPDGPPAAEPEPPAPAPQPLPVTGLPAAGPPAPAPPGWTPQPPPPAGWMPQPPPPPGWQPPPGMQPPPGWQPHPGAQPHPAAQPHPGAQPYPGAPPHPGAQPMKAQPYPYPFPYPMPMPAVRPHGMALAGLGKRLTARLIDIFAVLLINIVVNGYFGYLYLQDFRPAFRKYMDEVAAGNTAPILPVTDRMQTLSLAIVMIATLVWLAYEAPAIASSGQTLGKRIMGIKVVPVEKNEPLGFARAFARWGRLGIWNLFWWCGVGLIVQFVFALSPAFDPRLRQAWHDKAAATVVVDVPPGGAPPSTPSGGSR